MQKLREDLFERREITHIALADELPAEFTKERYIMVYRKIWATIRHDIWKECQRFKKEDRVATISEQRFNQIYEDVHKNFEQIRQDIYEKVMDVELQNKNDARTIMQTAYITYSTLSQSAGERSRWAEQVMETANKHNEYITQMIAGNFYPGIETDPRDSREADEKYDLSTLSKFQGLSTQKTMLSSKGRNTIPIKDRVDKYVDKMIEKAREAKKRVAERKAKEATVVEEDDPSKHDEESKVQRQQTGYIPKGDIKPPSDDEETAAKTPAETPGETPSGTPAETTETEAAAETPKVEDAPAATTTETPGAAETGDKKEGESKPEAGTQ